MKLAQKKNSKKTAEEQVQVETVEMNEQLDDNAVVTDQDGEGVTGADEASVEDGENPEMAALEKEKEEYKNALIRERADFENYKKRNASLASTSYNNGVIDTVTAILPVLDNFDRALCTECADQAFFDGMDMIKRQLMEVLKALGVEEIDVDGGFDPEFHDAVMQVDEEGHEPNAIVETLQKGYMLKDKILRHAMVKVNK